MSGTEAINIADFDYHLPLELIAQQAAEPRDSSRLMVLNRREQQIGHLSVFRDIVDYLKPGDALVVNESKVIPARLFGRKAASGGQMELLLLRPADHRSTILDAVIWEVLVRPGRGARVGAIFVFGDAQQLTAEVLEITPTGERIVRFNEPPLPFLNKFGQLPLPPYIHAKPVDPNRYQTIYATAPGSAAAPTAGLHFTSQLLERIADKGVSFERVLLHVGLDTFQPVKEENALEHKMHSEWCQLETVVAERLNRVREQGGRIIAVGTTTVRTLETAFDQSSGKLASYSGDTRIYLYPGKQLRAIDALVTNFHLPRSTLLLLVSAFAGREFMLEAYSEAVKLGYRFFSFGDAMLIL
jgi:S-adenosylmethionine:tRNA ribosyltransferase-isomerase